ncbi:MAG: SCO family protein [Anaerolineales bacterium]
MKNKTIPLIIASIVILTAGVYFLAPHNFHGTVIQSPDPAFDFTLTSAHGDVKLSDFRGKLVLLYFGYTFCPDVCPATLANVGQAFRKLGKAADDAQLIMISVDPERDDPQKLADYVAHFYPTFIGVTGSTAQIDEVTSLYGIFYQKHEGTAATGYLVDHTATLLVVDREGYLKLIFPFGATIDDLADDLKYMLK